MPIQLSGEQIAVIQGRYYWQLVFHYDNRNNTGTIVREFELVRRQSINVKDFYSRTFRIEEAFKFEQKANFGLKFSIVNIGGSTDFNLHRETSTELVERSETGQTREETLTDRHRYEVAGGGMLNLYRLVYVSNGVLVPTEIVSTEHSDDIFVDIEFTVTPRLLGFDKIRDQLSTTRPSRDNIVEWDAIRQSIVRYRDQPEQVQFRRLVEALGEIRPGQDNLLEWRQIRGTSAEILASWDYVEKQRLLIKLLEQFRITSPAHDNVREWQEIQRVSSEILGGLVRIF